MGKEEQNAVLRTKLETADDKLRKIRENITNKLGDVRGMAHWSCIGRKKLETYLRGLLDLT